MTSGPFKIWSEAFGVLFCLTGLLAFFGTCEFLVAWKFWELLGIGVFVLKLRSLHPESNFLTANFLPLTQWTCLRTDSVMAAS